jgi:predicted DNA-binding transcriptional regulator YafY
VSPDLVARHTAALQSRIGRTAGASLRYEKLEALLRVALDMRGTAEGLSLEDIQRVYGVSRRTAERMRDVIERVFPQMEQANPGELPKRWRIRTGVLGGMVGFSVEEMVSLTTAAHLARRDNLPKRPRGSKSSPPS